MMYNARRRICMYMWLARLGMHIATLFGKSTEGCKVDQGMSENIEMRKSEQRRWNECMIMCAHGKQSFDFKTDTSQSTISHRNGQTVTSHGSVSFSTLPSKIYKVFCTTVLLIGINPRSSDPTQRVWPSVAFAAKHPECRISELGHALLPQVVHVTSLALLPSHRKNFVGISYRRASKVHQISRMGIKRIS